MCQPGWEGSLGGNGYMYMYGWVLSMFIWNRILAVLVLITMSADRELGFSSVQSLSRVRLFVTPWIAACQASLSITNSQSSLKLTSIELVMPSSHLILCHPLLLLPPIPPSIRVFSNECSSEGMMLKLKLQYFGQLQHYMHKYNWFVPPVSNCIIIFCCPHSNQARGMLCV